MFVVAPINVKSVLPIVLIVYCLPTTKEPAATSCIPTLVAVKKVPTLLSAEPNEVNVVVPADTIAYFVPTTKEPAAVIAGAPAACQFACFVADTLVAVPSPVPWPVAVNTMPTVFADAPINVKSVVPTETIVYSVSVTNAPAVTVARVSVPNDVIV